MADVPTHDRKGSQDTAEVPSQFATSLATDDGLKQDVLDDTQALLQKVAQDATIQLDEDATSPARQQNGESTTPSPQGIAPADARPDSSSAGVNGAVTDGVDHSFRSNIQPYGLDTQSILPRSEHLDQPGLMNGSVDLAQVNEALVDDPKLEAATSIVESEAPRIQAFAKLEFDDGEFYMNTYSVELGRDVRAARQAYETDLQAVQQAGAKLRKRSSSSGNISRSSSKIKQEDGGHLAGSVVSESGGIMGVDRSDSEEPRQRKHKKSKSTSSSSRQLSRKSSINFPGMRTDYQSLAMASLLDPSADEQLVDPRNPLPSPESCPLVPIHPPAATDGVPTSHKSISRKHVRIAFNFEKHLFEVVVLGRNGAFVDEEWYPEGDVQPLRSGSLIQIGGVGIRFLLPDVAPGETGAENIMSSDPASFDIENGPGTYGDVAESNDDNNERDGGDEDEDGSEGDSDHNKSDESDRENQSSEPSEEETRGRPRQPRELKPTVANRPVRNRKPMRSKESTKAKEPPKAKRPTKAKLKLTTKETVKLDPITPPPKRKGPGRPPKNGIISKREQALLARQAREAAKAAAQGDSSAPPGRGKGKSIPASTEVKQEKEKNLLQPNGKRKYKKRKTKAELEAGEQQAVRESTEHTDAVPPEQNAAPPPKPAKPVKPPKPPRSPSPVFDEATLTPEQLAKPQSSYVVLIHEALSNSPTGQMSLPQIYRAIERKYPFYKLRVQTTGWQSSVRHNLSQHPAFRKIERDGKGWMWGLVPEVSIEKEKKRRLTPPPMPAQGYYPGAQMLQPPYPYGAMPGPMPYGLYGPYPDLPMGQRPYPPPSSYLPQSTASALPPALVNAQVDNSATYQSPYATGPPKTAPGTSQAPQAPTLNGESNNPNPTTAQEDHSSNTNSHPPQPAQSLPIPRPPTASTTPSHASQPPLPSPPPRPPSHSSTQPPQQQHTPEVLSVVHKFKSYLLNSMADNPGADTLIESAINRVLNNQPPPSSPNPNSEPEGSGKEKAIMKILQGMLDNLRKKELPVGGQGNNTFGEILKQVHQDGGTSLPSDPASLPLPLLGQVKGTAALGKEAVGEGGKEEEEGEGNKEKEDGDDREEDERKGDGKDEDAVSATATGGGERGGLKRALSNEIDEQGGVMDATSMRDAKRVATRTSDVY
ncbi:MAG: hypothetical protein Q9201_002909 [Fulgogasparrea decipioides]